MGMTSAKTLYTLKIKVIPGVNFFRSNMMTSSKIYINLTSVKYFKALFQKKNPRSIFIIFIDIDNMITIIILLNFIKN